MKVWGHIVKKGVKTFSGCDKNPVFVVRLTINSLSRSYVLRRNGTPPLFDVLPFEINNENYFLLIGFICTNFDNFPRSAVG